MLVHFHARCENVRRIVGGVVVEWGVRLRKQDVDVLIGRKFPVQPSKHAQIQEETFGIGRHRGQIKRDVDVTKTPIPIHPAPHLEVLPPLERFILSEVERHVSTVLVPHQRSIWQTDVKIGHGQPFVHLFALNHQVLLEHLRLPFHCKLNLAGFGHEKWHVIAVAVPHHLFRQKFP